MWAKRRFLITAIWMIRSISIVSGNFPYQVLLILQPVQQVGCGNFKSKPHNERQAITKGRLGRRLEAARIPSGFQYVVAVHFPSRRR